VLLWLSWIEIALLRYKGEVSVRVLIPSGIEEALLLLDTPIKDKKPRPTTVTILISFFIPPLLIILTLPSGFINVKHIL